jgi:hypothetical protein
MPIALPHGVPSMCQVAVSALSPLTLPFLERTGNVEPVPDVPGRDTCED